MHAVGARTGPPVTVDHIRCRWEIAVRVFRRVGIRRAFEGGVGLASAGRRRSVARVWISLTVLPPRFRLEWTRHHHHTPRRRALGALRHLRWQNSGLLNALPLRLMHPLLLHSQRTSSALHNNLTRIFLTHWWLRGCCHRVPLSTQPSQPHAAVLRLLLTLQLLVLLSLHRLRRLPPALASRRRAFLRSPPLRARSFRHRRLLQSQRLMQPSPPHS